jgi:hypothetical protein
MRLKRNSQISEKNALKKKKALEENDRKLAIELSIKEGKKLTRAT